MSDPIKAAKAGCILLEVVLPVAIIFIALYNKDYTMADLLQMSVAVIVIVAVAMLTVLLVFWLLLRICVKFDAQPNLK